MEPADLGYRPVRWLRSVTIVLNIIATAWIVLLLLMINVDVFSFNVFGRPIVGVKETVGVSIAGIVFLQLAETLRTGRHIRSDLFLARVTLSRPRVGATLDSIYHLTGAVLMGFIVWFAIPLVSTAYSNAYYVGTPGVFTLPTWPVLAVVVLGALVTFLQFFVQAVTLAAFAVGRVPAERNSF